MPRRLPVLLLGVLACQATTARPALVPLPRALTAEVRFDLRGGTDHLRTVFEANQVPVARVELEDGYLESPWFSATDGRTTGAREAGEEVVKVRGWVDPAQPGYVRYTIEIAYRPWNDPSRPARDLERQVPTGHPLSLRWRQQLMELITTYGNPSAADSTRLGITP